MAKTIAPLTVAAIRSAKPAAKVLRDGGGLYLLLQDTGRHLWRFDYRFQGTRKTLSMGVYPDVSLADARERREEARRLVANGIDPSLQRKATKAANLEKAGNSLEVVAREWFEGRRATWVKSHADKIILRLENDIFPWLGKRPIADVTAKELLATLNRVVDREAVESAHRILQNCNQVFRYAIATGRAERNPAADLRGALPPVKPTHHAAILNPKEVGALLRAIDGYKGAFVTKCALKLAPLLFVRPGELRNAEWSEIDLEAAQWEIPGSKMKMGQPLIVPLAHQALEVLKELQQVTGRGRYVFPSARGGDRPMSNNAVLAALRRMGYANDEMTGHGFRAMARTILDETLHFRPDYIEQQLAHAVRDPNGRAYNRTAHLPERRKMMASWADHLDSLR
ncbi:tyrosine-type recombinase/integrase [Pseudoxanthomonas sp.]|jgi:integrase|uniref:tyrosine-type recombinase/integrase n=1 Tax=Pseudoxanthomonas sp. TaxID=1871049 RepID=UPI002E110CE0|nr:integrase arm-type DNA-binding domain-containing protein [Pseudoxanthomonas sp.]